MSSTVSYTSTLMLQHPPNVTEYLVYKSLNHHGSISSISKVTHGQSKIVITTAMPIEQLMPDETVSIEGIDYDFFIDSAKKYKESKEILPVADSLRQAPDQDSMHQILNCLCDDILHMIFKCYLDVKQLVEIAKVCMRFHAIAEDVFKTKYSEKIDFDLEMGRDAPIWMVEEFFDTFGSFVKTMHASHACLPIILELAASYCNNLETLNCSMSVLRRKCTLPHNKFRKLINLYFRDMYFDDLQATETFFTLNSQLKKLTLNEMRMAFGIEHVLRHLPALELLNVRLVNRRCIDVKCFRQLKYLKSLRLCGFRRMDVPLILNEMIVGNVKLERLQLDGNFKKDMKIIEMICQMKSIKSLHIGLIDDSNLLCLILNLGNLTEIDVIRSDVTIIGVRHLLEQSTHQLKRASFQTRRCGDSIDADDIIAIDEMRKSRSMDLHVRVENAGQVSIRIETLLQQHSAWLEIVKPSPNMLDNEFSRAVIYLRRC